MEISSLAHGSYNLGFLAVSRSANSQAFLQWWADRLFLYCYDDKSRGIFTDQKWIDLAPSFFDVAILKHHGYDFATWRSEEHTSELQSLMRISYAVFCLKKKNKHKKNIPIN